MLAPTARTKETLEQTVKPILVAFLAERSLELSEQKTTITHIQKTPSILSGAAVLSGARP